MAGWLATHGIEAAGPRPWQRIHSLWVLKTCPWNPEHRETAHMVQFDNGALAAGCFHNSCSGKTWRDLRALVEPNHGGGGGGEPHAVRLLRLVREAGAELWHTKDNDAFISFPVKGHLEHHPIGSRAVTLRLRELFHENGPGGVPTAEALRGAIGAMEADALFSGPEHQVHLRAAARDGDIHIDLGDASWSAVHVSSGGWEVLSQPPVRFRRPKGMQELPMPEKGGSVEELRRFVNISSEGDFALLVASLTSYLASMALFPILAFVGEQGTAKTTTAKMVVRLLDPYRALVTSLPRNADDLAVTAHNRYLLAFDNLSGLTPWLSDALCSMATGGGLGKRQQYENDALFMLDYCRPVMLNGIDDVTTRGDLADRAVLITLARIPASKRRRESEIWEDFNAAAGRLLGGLLTLVAASLRELPSVRLMEAPRMADFAHWGVAVERAAGWDEGLFVEAYTKSRLRADHAALDAEPVIGVLLDYLGSSGGKFTGTATELLGALDRVAGDKTKNPRWPSATNVLSGKLRRTAAQLAEHGIEIVFREEGRQQRRVIEITAQGDADGADDARG